MLIWLNKQGVRGDRGFEVQFTGRFDAEYREGDKILDLYIEDGVDRDLPCIIVGVRSLEKWRDGAVISPDKAIEILRNFKEAMEFQGLATIVDRSR